MRFGHPQKGTPAAQRTQRAILENAAAAAPTTAPADQSGGGGGPITENLVIFDPVDGHAHTGGDSHTVDHANLANVLPDQHHNQAHVLATTSGLGPDHLVSGLTTGQVLTATGANSAQFQAPPAVTHNLLSATHPDTTAATVVRGDLVTGQAASPLWKRLALGLSGRYLRSDGTDAVWAQIPYTDLTYSGLTAGRVLTATGSGAASFQPIPAGVLVVTETSFGQSPSTGTSGLFSDADHTHGTPTDPIPAHVADADPHPQYQLATSGVVSQIWTGWYVANVSLVATTPPDVMTRFSGVTCVRMPYDGTLVGIGAMMNADIGGSGTVLNFEVYIATSDSGSFSPTSVVCAIAGTTGTERTASTVGTSVAFNAGDLLQITVQRTGILGVVPAEAYLVVVYD